MNLPPLEQLWQWLLEATLRGSLLIAGVVFLRACLGRFLPARFFHLLWVLAALRLLCPIPLATPWSACNFLLPRAETTAPQEDAGWQIRQSAAAAPARGEEPETPTAPAISPATFSWRNAVPALWLGGVILQGIWLVACAWRVRQMVRAGVPVVHPELGPLLRELAGELRLRRVPKLWQTDAVTGPALVGLWRPAILIPSAWKDGLDRNEWRAVLRHELLHVRRHDLAAAWLLTLARIVHWFNPLVWLTERLGKREIEFACDEAVMETGEAPVFYGETLLHLAQRIHRPAIALPSLGILQAKQTLRARLMRIGGYSTPGWSRWTCSATLLVLVAAAFGANEQGPSATPPVKTSEAAEKTPEVPAVAPKEATAASTKPQPEWIKGWTVQGIVIPSNGWMNQAYVRLRDAAGRDLTFTEGEVSADGVTLIKVDWVGAPVQARVTLRRGEERATLLANASLVSRDDTLKAVGPTVEIEARYIEMPDKVWLEQTKKWFQPASSVLPLGGREGLVVGIFDNKQTEEFVTQMTGQKDVELISAPRVQTRSQQRAIVEIIREFRYPTEFDPPTEKVKYWTPTAFQTENLGVTLEVEPVLSVEETVDLRLKPFVVEFVGFVETAPGKQARSIRSKPQPSKSSRLLTLARIMHPDPGAEGLSRPKSIFHTRSTEASVTVLPKHTIVLQLSNPEDTAPFPNPSAGRTLIVLVTARRFSPF